MDWRALGLGDDCVLDEQQEEAVEEEEANCDGLGATMAAGHEWLIPDTLALATILPLSNGSGLRGPEEEDAALERA